MHQRRSSVWVIPHSTIEGLLHIVLKAAETPAHSLNGCPSTDCRQASWKLLSIASQKAETKTGSSEKPEPERPKQEPRMRITIQNDADGIVFESDGQTVSMPTDQAQRSFVFYSLMGSLALLCQIPQMHEIPDDAPETGAIKQ